MVSRFWPRVHWQANESHHINTLIELHIERHGHVRSHCSHAAINTVSDAHIRYSQLDRDRNRDSYVEQVLQSAYHVA